MSTEPEETNKRLVWVPRHGGRSRWLGRLSILALFCAGAALIGFQVLQLKYGSGLPDIPKAEDYRPPILSEVYTADGVLAGEFYDQRRKVVPYERIPKRLVQAFIASEDQSFFTHHGVDVLGTARAAFKTVMKKITGKGSVQGGSTLTQQTAKAVLIANEGYKTATEKSMKRKIREALLARRLETELTKEEILYLYLNNVYLGHHSYGVQSAAENYYRKDVKDLSLAEMALIAGLPQAPSAYSPFLNPEAAKKRRSYVLKRMLDEGMISKKEHETASAEQVHVFPVEDVFHTFAPYFTEEMRRYTVDKYTNSALLQGGLKIFATMDSERQRAAQDSVMSGLLEIDKRQGFRGPLGKLKTDAEKKAFNEKISKVLGDEKLKLNELYVGFVESIEGDPDAAIVRIGKEKAYLPIVGMRWARPVNNEAYYPSSLISKVKSALAVGDIVVVRAVEKKQLYDDQEQGQGSADFQADEHHSLVRFEQDPDLQSALVSIDPNRQYLVAMVGGYDFDANEFNRAFQACRQPGSGYKPVVYSAALEKDPPGYTEATQISDSPIVYDDPANETRWKPQNFEEDFKGYVLLRTALVNSMNLPAIKTFIAVGVNPMLEWHKKMGFSTPMNPDFSSALGSSCVKPYEIARVYTIFNQMGLKRSTYFVRKIEDRFGRTVEDHTAFDDPWAKLSDRVAAGYARLFENPERVMSAETAYITTDLLRNVVREGTGAPANRLGKPAAGKTGTTSDSYDVWFNGFTKDLVTSVWVGYDLNHHPLGKYETGGRAALPIWLDYMKVALEGRSQPEFTVPAGVDVVSNYIDPNTGQLAAEGSHKKILMYFKTGTAPKGRAAKAGTTDVNKFMLEGN